MNARSSTGRRDRDHARAAKTLRSVARAALVVTLLACALARAADDAASPAAGAESPARSAQLVKPGLYRVESALVRVGPQGVIVVDAKGAGTYGRLMAEIEQLAKTSRPAVRALILTGAAGDDAGSAARFIDAGVPLVLQKRALARLRDEAPPMRAAAAGPLVVTYDTDYRTTAAGVVVEVEHVGRARSAADSIVLFPDLRVLAVGDLYTTDTPQPDCASGGSFAGWAAAITHLLWSDFDVALPSRGPAVGKPELAAFKAKLEALAQRHAGDQRSGCLVAAGVPR